MNGRFFRLGLVVFALPVSAIAVVVRNDFEKSPAFFVNRYGLPEKTRDLEAHPFIREGHGFIELKGGYSVRWYRRNGMIVQAVFARSNPQLAGVIYTFDRPWTVDEMDALLAQFGHRWRREWDGQYLTFVDPRGARAVVLKTTVHFVSAEVVTAMEEALAARSSRQ